MAAEVRRFHRERDSVLDMGLPRSEIIDITPQPVSGDVREIEVELISPSPYQPRTKFSEVGIKALADSISSLGLINPVAVRPKNGAYELITGERRLRAVKSLGYPVIKATVHDVDDIKAAIMVFDENFRRKNLSEYENYRWVTIMIDEFKLRQVDIAEKLNISAGRLSQIMAVGKLPNDVIDRIAPMRFVTDHHIRTLRRLQRLDAKLMHNLLNEMEQNKLNGVEVVARCKQMVEESENIPTPVDGVLDDMNKKITYIQRNPGRFSAVELQRIRAQFLQMVEMANQFLKTDIGKEGSSPSELDKKSLACQTSAPTGRPLAG